MTFQKHFRRNKLNVDFVVRSDFYIKSFFQINFPPLISSGHFKPAGKFQIIVYEIINLYSYQPC